MEPALLHAGPKVLILPAGIGQAAELRAHLAGAGFHARIATSCREAEFLPADMAPDAILIERARWRDCECGSACRLRLRDHKHPIPVVPLPSMEENLCAFEGGQSGIDYATRLKQFLGRFNDRTRDTVLERRGITLDPVGDTVMRRGKSIHLSPILFRLLAYFMNHPDQVLTAKQLLADVWGRNSDPGRTVAMCIAYLRKAVADREANIIETVRGQGYVFRSGRPTAQLGSCAPLGVARPLRVRPRPRRQKASGHRALRPKERDLLELLMFNPRITFSRQSIADFLWGAGAVDLRTVDTTVSRIRQVFLQRSLGDPIRGVIGRGYQINVGSTVNHADTLLAVPAPPKDT